MHKCVWTPVIGEEIILDAEGRNEHNDDAVVVMNDGFIVGHIPHSISNHCR